LTARRQPISAEELALVEEVGKRVDDLVVVMNKADRTSDEDRRIAKSLTSKIIEKRLERLAGRIYEVSAEERLENRGSERDWEQLIDALGNLERESGGSLVRTAAERGFRRLSEELLSIISEERELCGGLLRTPNTESETCARPSRRRSDRISQGLLPFRGDRNDFLGKLARMPNTLD
jgi:hypothetical protein